MSQFSCFFCGTPIFKIVPNNINDLQRFWKKVRKTGKEIAEHITGIRKQAQQLKDKTNEALKKASEEIEKILLN